MVLATDEIFIMSDTNRQTDFVAGRAKLGVLENRSKERLFMHLGLGLHERVIDPLQERIVAESERIM